VTQLLIGVDVGTASTKGILARPDGEIVATAVRAHGIDLPQPGWVEQDAERIWWGDFVAIVGELLASTPAGARVAAVCCSGIGPCALAADGAGRPLRPAILYGIDTRATREIDELTERYGAEEILARCGSPLTSQAVGPKLAWLRANEPDVWDATRRLLMASSYVVQQLSGEYVLDHHSASQCDPLYDLDRNAWIEDWADEIAPGLELPRLLWPGEIAGAVTAAAAAETGLAEGTPVLAGTIDAWAEALSVGVRGAGDVMLMYGSTMFLVEVVGALPGDRRLWQTAGALEGTRTLAAGMATSGSLTAWFRELAGEPSFAELVAEAGAVPAGAHGLLALPYFAGERTPLFDPDARGVLCGLTLSHTRGDIYRALLEATAFGVRHNLQAMAEAGGHARRLVAVGGGTTGAVWTQIVSDVTGREQELPAVTVGAAYGDAWLAAAAAGLTDPARSWAPAGTTVRPRDDVADRYDELFALYLDLYPATRPHVARLAELQRQDHQQPAGSTPAGA
jgi:xylulokinase